MSDDTTDTTDTNDIDLLNAQLQTDTGPSWADIYLEDDATEVSYLTSVDISDGELTIRVYHPNYSDDADEVATYQFPIATAPTQ